MHIKWKAKPSCTLQGNTEFHPSLSSGWAARSISLNLRSPSWPSSPRHSAPRLVSSRRPSFDENWVCLPFHPDDSPLLSLLFAYPFRDRRRRRARGFLTLGASRRDAARRDATRHGAARSGAWEGIETRAKGVFPPCARSRSMGSPWRQTSPYLYSPRYFLVKLPELPASCRPCYRAPFAQGPQGSRSRSFYPRWNRPKVDGLS